MSDYKARRSPFAYEQRVSLASLPTLHDLEAKGAGDSKRSVVPSGARGGIFDALKVIFYIKIYMYSFCHISLEGKESKGKEKVTNWQVDRFPRPRPLFHFEL